MRKMLLLSILIVSIINAKAQTAVTSLSENFNTSCASSSGFPVNWNMYNPVPGTAPAGAWTCGPTEGRGPTPGMLCTGTYGTPATYNVDTSYLITPLLDIDSYAPGHFYLRFDTKTTSIDLGGIINVLETKFYDSTFHLTGFSDTDMTGAISPVIGEGDLSGWVTHEVDLSVFEGRGPFYIAFRYGSTAASGNIWYLDNVSTSTTSILHVAGISRNEMSLKVIGNATSEQIIISYTTETAGINNLELYDMMGRVVYKDILNAQSGTFTYHINDLNLRPGMYLIKMGNGNYYGTAKVIIQ